MGYLSHRVDRSEIKAGDHIYTYRSSFIYSHHGIYIGGNMVIHFTAPENATSDSALNFSSVFPTSSPNLSASCLNSPGCQFPHPETEEICNLSSFIDPNISMSINVCGFHQRKSGVILSCLNCFIGTGSLRLYQYQVKSYVYVSKLRGGTCTIAKSDPPQEVVHKAEYLLEHGFGSYDVVRNNCEDFALYCKTGLLIGGQTKTIGGQTKTATGSSGQVNFMNTVINSSVGVMVDSTVQRIVWGSIPIGGVAVAVGMNVWKRYNADIGVRDDVVNVKVEDVAFSRGG